MGVEISKIPYPTVEGEVLDALTEAGFYPVLRNAFIVLKEGLPKPRSYRGVLIDSTRIEGHCHYRGGSVIPPAGTGESKLVVASLRGFHSSCSWPDHLELAESRLNR